MNNHLPSDQSVTAMTRRLAGGDEQAWLWLHQHYFGILHHAAIARGATPSDAADLVQRTYLRVLRHAKRFRREQDFRSWLCCLLRCETIDAARHGIRRSRLMEMFRHREEFRTHPPDPPCGSLLDDLAPADRDLMTRHYIDGCSQRELAAEHGTSAKAIESRLARLRKRLRAVLDSPHTC